MLISTSSALGNPISSRSKASRIADRECLPPCSPFLLHTNLMTNVNLLETKNRSATSKLTMENVPWHADVKAFSEALSLKSEGEYEVACEHAHSCCVLLGRTQKFKKNGKWFTWIDYEKFHDLVSLLNQHPKYIISLQKNQDSF